MRYLMLIPALLLDFVQFMFSLAFLGLGAITPIGGGAGGAAAGAYLCWNSAGGVISGVLGAIKCAALGGLVGAAASAFSVPLGMAVDTTLSITIGGALLLFLAFEGMFYYDLVLPGFLGEVAPVFNFLPIWTGLTLACIIRKNKEEGRSTMGVVGAVLGMAMGGTPTAIQGLTKLAPVMNRARAALYRRPGEQAAPEEKGEQRGPALLPNKFSDIRRVAKGASLALLLVLGAQAHAQTVPDPVQYIVAPETPGPRDTVLIEAQGVGPFLGNATITWSQDGKVVKQGVGERQYSFTTGPLGGKTTVRVSIDSSQGTFTQSWIFSPSLVNFVWEAHTSIPPFYRGKALYSAGSDLTVVAYPTVYSGSARVLPSALSYQWFRKGQAVPSASGLGRYAYSFSGDELQPSEDISLDVYYGAAKVAHGEVSIPASDPQVLLYPYDPLRGELFDSALPAAIQLLGKELTVQAEPYYFSVAAQKAGRISYAWTLNDTEVTGPDSARGALTLRQAGAGEGSATLGLAVQNNDSSQFVQSASTGLKLVFGASSGNSLLNFFGL